MRRGGGGGWAVPGGTTVVGTGTVSANIQLTSMNQRQALSSGYRLDLFLSSVLMAPNDDTPRCAEVFPK